jgi:hypothetical protein
METDDIEKKKDEITKWAMRNGWVCIDTKEDFWEHRQHGLLHWRQVGRFLHPDCNEAEQEGDGIISEQKIKQGPVINIETMDIKLEAAERNEPEPEWRESVESLDEIIERQTQIYIADLRAVMETRFAAIEETYRDGLLKGIEIVKNGEGE